MNNETAPHRNELSVTLPSDTEVHAERHFDAPVDLVWDCYTDPVLIPEWLGPKALKTRVEEWNFEVGGKWRYISTADDGTEYEFFGEFKEIDKPRKIVQSFNFVMEPQPPAQTDTVTFEEADAGRTKLTTNTVFDSKEHRDGMVQSGMEDGMTESYEQLEELMEGRS